MFAYFLTCVKKKRFFSSVRYEGIYLNLHINLKIILKVLLSLTGLAFMHSSFIHDRHI